VRRSFRLLLGLVVLALTGAAAAAYRFWWMSAAAQPAAIVETPAIPSADPRLLYGGAYRNVHPDVQYVGDAACTKCHVDVAATYQHHPMGRSTAPIAALAPRQAYDAKHNNPFESLGARFLVERRGERVIHRETRLDDQGQPIYEREFEVNFVIGSGTRGYSYVTNRDGRLFQTPISWFAQRNIWDLSPGFKAKHVTSRPINGECLFCHANRTQFQEDSVNRFDEPLFRGFAIGCERCHGPGEKHIRSMDKLDIVNPRGLPAALRDAVCQQCHLEGVVRLLPRGRHLYDFRPGLPLESCWTIFVRADDSAEGRRAVNHVEQMRQSVCFQKSDGERKLGCLSCHDPHVRPAPSESAAYFRGSCLQCHQEQSCTAPAPARREHADNCNACHMPSYGSVDVAHTASTDHRILRRKNRETDAAVAKKLWADLPITLFHDDGDARDPERARDLGIALVLLMSKGKIDPLLYKSRALDLCEKATLRDPDDVEAWQARGHALMLQGEKLPALQAFETALAKHPDYETAVIAAAAAAQGVPHPGRALKHWRRAVELNPWMPEYRANFAGMLARQGAWEEARQQCDELLKLDPADVEARMLRINCLLHADRTAQARAEFTKVEALRPPNLEELKFWFAQQLGQSR
jgi:Tfp pilus assembly protein PilF